MATLDEGIDCPECGGDALSSFSTHTCCYTTSCDQCGYYGVEFDCPDCGTIEVDDEQTTCPDCGHQHRP